MADQEINQLILQVQTPEGGEKLDKLREAIEGVGKAYDELKKKATEDTPEGQKAAKTAEEVLKSYKSLQDTFVQLNKARYEYLETVRRENDLLQRNKEILSSRQINMRDENNALRDTAKDLFKKDDDKDKESLGSRFLKEATAVKNVAWDKGTEEAMAKVRTDSLEFLKNLSASVVVGKGVAEAISFVTENSKDAGDYIKKWGDSLDKTNPKLAIAAKTVGEFVGSLNAVSAGKYWAETAEEGTKETGMRGILRSIVGVALPIVSNKEAGDIIGRVIRGFTGAKTEEEKTTDVAETYKDAFSKILSPEQKDVQRTIDETVGKVGGKDFIDALTEGMDKKTKEQTLLTLQKAREKGDQESLDKIKDTLMKRGRWDMIVKMGESGPEGDAKKAKEKADEEYNKQFIEDIGKTPEQIERDRIKRVGTPEEKIGQARMDVANKAWEDEAKENERNKKKFEQEKKQRETEQGKAIDETFADMPGLDDQIRKEIFERMVKRGGKKKFKGEDIMESEAGWVGSELGEMLESMGMDRETAYAKAHEKVKGVKRSMNKSIYDASVREQVAEKPQIFNLDDLNAMVQQAGPKEVLDVNKQMANSLASIDNKIGNVGGIRP